MSYRTFYSQSVRFSFRAGREKAASWDHEGGVYDRGAEIPAGEDVVINGFRSVMVDNDVKEALW